MQVNSSSLFATFFAFITLVAPWAAHALVITTGPTLATGNATISCTGEDTDPIGPFTLLVHKDSTRIVVASNVVPPPPSPGPASPIAVMIPTGISGPGWTIQALASDDTLAGESNIFTITEPHNEHGSHAGVIVGSVLAFIVVVSLILLGIFLYVRRQRQRATPTFYIEDGLQATGHDRSNSSTSLGSSITTTKDKRSLEIDKLQWELQLEEQFARARAGTPDVQRRVSPISGRGESPMPLAPHQSPDMPLVPQRAVPRNYVSRGKRSSIPPSMPSF